MYWDRYLTEKRILSVKIVSLNSITLLFLLLSLSMTFFFGLGLLISLPTAALVTYLVSLQIAKSKRRALANFSAEEIGNNAKKNAINETSWSSITKGEINRNKLTLYSELLGDSQKPRKEVIKATLNAEPEFSQVKEFLSSKLGEKLTVVT